MLKEKGIKFKTQYPVLGKYLADIFIKPNIVVEADGEYWHNRPGAQAKDKKRNKEMTLAGYKVLRLKENEINNLLNNCWGKITAIIESK